MPDAPGSRDEPPHVAGGYPDKLASQVARRIEAEVIQRGWPVGDSLASEPELRERFGISQTVLREAVRLVEHHEVATMRRGPNGGLIVCAPDVGPAIRATVTYLEYVGTGSHDMLHVSRLIEPIAARLAAERIHEGGITVLRQTLAAEVHLADATSNWAANPLHVVLSRLAGNPVLQLFADVLNQLTLRYVRTSARKSDAEVRRAMDQSHQRHIEITEAVVAGDAALAQTRLVEHLDEVTAWLATDRLEQRPSGPAASAFAVSSVTGPDAKLAEVVARRIQEDIAEQHLPVGLVIGSESEVMGRYGISRAVLRAAVRLLEHHSVARSRRGPGGGIIVARPEPQASIDTTALYLAFRRATHEDLRVVREAIELGTVSELVRRHGEQGIAQQLELVGTRIANGSPDERTVADGFHIQLAEVSGNPVLSLFLRIIADLSLRNRAVHASDPAGGPSEGIDRIHGAILDAIREGDAGLAQHRMRRHLLTR